MATHGATTPKPWEGYSRSTLFCRRTLRPPEEAGMPDFKEPDDTREPEEKGHDAW